MANIRSAIKHVRQDRKRHLRNSRVRSRMKTFVKKAAAVIAEGNRDSATEAVRMAVSEIDKAAQKGIIHRSNAARRKSRLMQHLNGIA